jgi:hypothetical protein
MSDGHSGLKNSKVVEVTNGKFVSALSYLELNSRSAEYVIHLFSNSGYTSGLQPSRNDLFKGESFPELIGFDYFEPCNVLTSGRCHYSVIGQINRERFFDDFKFVNPFIDNYKRFANELDSTYETLRTLANRLLELGLKLPRWEYQIVKVSEKERIYPKGSSYDFYYDVAQITNKASSEIFLVDSYPNEDVINLYLAKVNPSIPMRILLKSPKENFIQVATKFKDSRKLEVRKSEDCHDRLFFVDSACYVMGQSVKDAGKKPTYLIQVGSYDALKSIYQNVWDKAARVV